LPLKHPLIYIAKNIGYAMVAKRVNWMIPIGLTFMGLGIDFILFYNKITSNEVACPIGGSCNFVNNSVFSEMFGIPVSVFGLLAFAFFLVISWTAWHKRMDETLALKAIAVMSGLTLLGIAYFVYLMIFVLEAICSWCMFSHLIMLTIFLFSIYYLKSEQGKKSAPPISRAKKSKRGKKK